MTKELIVQNAVNDNNLVTKRTLEDAVMRRFYYCHNLAHNKSTLVKFVLSGANVLMSNSAYFCINNNALTVQEGSLYEFHFKDSYKGGAAALQIRMSDTKGTRITNIFINRQDTNNKWIDINIFHNVRLLPGH